MTCQNCGGPLSAGELVCPNCWHRARPTSAPADPGPGSLSPLRPAPQGPRQTALLDQVLGQTVEFTNVEVLGILDDTPIRKSQTMGGPMQKKLFTLGIFIVVLWVLWSFLKALVINLFWFVAMIIGLLLALSVMFGGGQDIIKNLLMVPIKLIQALAGGLFGAFREQSGGLSGRLADQDRTIPVKNIQISVAGKPRTIRVEGYFTVGSVSPSHQIDVTARQSKSHGGLMFVRGFNRTLGCQLLVSKS